MIELEIKKATIKQEVEIEQVKAIYTPEDIEQLVRADLEEKGYIVESILIDTDYKYIDDEWGMNRSLNTFLRGVTAKIS